MPPRAPNPVGLPPPPPGLIGVELSRWIIRACTDSLGFALAGVCEATPSERAAELKAWLAAGKHGEMDFLTELLDERLDPARELPGARSIIMVADAYGSRSPTSSAPDSITDGTPAPAGRIARYAQGRDYHEVLKRRLHRLADALRSSLPEHTFRTFTDTGPVLEREHAARAGLGWTGKHTLIIHPRIGSWFVLGGILTTLDLPAPPEQQPVADACGTCTRCIDACPTSAITPRSVDATRCISYLTIEHRSIIQPALALSMGDWLFGCDICQDVCPHNSPRDLVSPPANPAYQPRTPRLPILDLLNWTEADRARTIGVSAIKRASLDMLKRNALIAAGNTMQLPRDQALLSRIREIAADATQPDLLRQTAATVLARFIPAS